MDYKKADSGQCCLKLSLLFCHILFYTLSKHIVGLYVTASKQDFFCPNTKYSINLYTV